MAVEKQKGKHICGSLFSNKEHYFQNAMQVKCKTCLSPHCAYQLPTFQTALLLPSETSPVLILTEAYLNTETQWVYFKDADPPLTFLNSVGFKSNPQGILNSWGEHLFLTGSSRTKSTPSASAACYMNCGKG